MKKNLFIAIFITINHLSYAGTDFDIYVTNNSDTDYTLTEAGRDCWYSFEAPSEPIPAHSAPEPNVPTFSTQSNNFTYSMCSQYTSKIIGIEFTPASTSRFQSHHIDLRVDKPLKTVLWSIFDETTQKGSAYPIPCDYSGGVVNGSIVINPDGSMDFPNDLTCTY